MHAPHAVLTQEHAHLDCADAHERAKPATGWEWWPAWHEATIRVNRLRQSRLEAMERIIRRSLHDGNPF